ncbi:hypothetical protein NL676_003989 [Syzygium grande]|nr:hypothetical protein NL676_003989 [Syzygium grande]
MDDALALRVSRAGPVGSGSTRYDVFLSFTSGSDAARDSFSGHLHASLAAAGVSICRPDERQAIGSLSRLPDEDARRSKICIPILSEDYPSSERCLRGLVQMMEEDIEEELRALKGVSLLHGWRKVTDGPEEELVKIVVQTVIRCLQPNIPKGPRIARSDGELIKVVVQGVLRQLRHHFQLDVPEHLTRRGNGGNDAEKSPRPFPLRGKLQQPRRHQAIWLAGPVPFIERERGGREGAQSIRAKKKKSMEDGALALCVYRAGPVACRSTHYDVFLSFPGGSDTARGSFPGRLHAGLAAAGVSLCEPDNSQAVGSSSPLPDAAVLQQSKICIPILSRDYPSSDRCLRGLVQMMAGKRSARQMVLPVFDGVEPSRVRYLTGSFEKVRHSDIEGVQRALFDVSMLHGWEVTDGREEELVKTVVQTVQRCLRPDLQKVPQIASDVRSGRAFHFRAIHEHEKDVAEAKQALRHLGYFGGFHDRDGRIDDGKLTRDVVQQTLRKLRHRFQLDVPEHLLSIDDRVKSRLDHEVLKDSTPPHECS